MIALVRYELALLARSQRWIPPLVLYVLGVVGLGGTSGGSHPQSVGEALRWSALMLVPVVAWLTRSALTGEPDAARACVAAAAGPRRAQVAALTAALAAGMVIAVAGIAWAMTLGAWGKDWLAGLGFGLGAVITCLLVGSAVGTACNPPLIRRPGMAMLSTAVLAILALESGASPANAAVTVAGGGVPGMPGHGWPIGLPLAAAVGLAAAAWTVSARAAARRSGGG